MRSQCPIQFHGVQVLFGFAAIFFLSLPLGRAVGFSTTVVMQDVEEADTLQALISKLADPMPAIRRNAESEILAVGEEALPHLRIGLRSSNLDIHNRCRVLLEKLEASRKARLSKVFLNAVDGDKTQQQFPAWSLFRQFAGNDTLATRKLFLEMCDSIPLVFEDYDLKVEQAGQALKRAARLALVKERHPSAAADVLLAAYLFLFDRACKTSRSEDEPLFNSVEVLEGINFVSNLEHAKVVRRSEHREVIDGVVADWVLSNVGSNKVVGDTMFNLIYTTRNPSLIDELASRYPSFDNARKLGFIDIVGRAATGENGVGVGRCYGWLEAALDDEGVLVDSRLQARTAEKVSVTPKLLAESTLATLLNSDAENGEPIKLEKVFGIYARSAKGFLIIKSQKERGVLSQRLRVHLQRSKSVE